MSDIIQLLPDHLANQIAAGEVIQRPASAVKELVENAIDASATEIQLLIKDAGKELIQVVDNGKGMSPMDARMCFERHATSKIRKIDDLFSIKTMGFRGEALASIAAVAQVELKTQTANEEVGTHILIEGSQILVNTSGAFHVGTSVAIKNLFYNVPARRKFLKSNTTEFKNIVEEFTRIVLTYPNIGFKLFHNNVEQLNLPISNLKARITNTLGSRFEKHLIPVQEEVDDIRISGYIGKPETANKTRGNQYFFVNNRYIKSPYLHHAVVRAFEGLIEKDTYPFYAIYFEINPDKVDVNVHPTKQEVKFEDEQMLYAYLNSAVKHSLSIHNVAPSIDFTLNPDITNMDAIRLPTTEQDIDDVAKGYLSNTFSQGGRAHFIEPNNNMRTWQNQREQIYDPWSKMNLDPSQDDAAIIPSKMMMHTPPVSDTKPSAAGRLQDIFDSIAGGQQVQTVLQWDDFLLTTLKSGLVLVHKKRALERITYEKLMRRLANQQHASQALLFPTTLELSPQDAIMLDSLIDDLFKLGYDISSLGNHTFCIQGTPVDITNGKETIILEEVLDNMRHENYDVKTTVEERLVQAMAKRISVNAKMEKEEAQALIDELFACQTPNYTPDGQYTFTILSKEHLLQLL